MKRRSTGAAALRTATITSRLTSQAPRAIARAGKNNNCAPADYCETARRPRQSRSFCINARRPFFSLSLFFSRSLSARHKVQRGGIKKSNFIIFSFNEIPRGDVVPLWPANLYPALFAIGPGFHLRQSVWPKVVSCSIAL